MEYELGDWEPSEGQKSCKNGGAHSNCTYNTL